MTTSIKVAVVLSLAVVVLVAFARMLSWLTRIPDSPLTCANCGLWVETEPTACPHCGAPWEAK